MTKPISNVARVHALEPLLRSIGREANERSAALFSLEATLLRLQDSPAHEQTYALLVEEAELQRSEINRLRCELEWLGCSILGMNPLTLCVPSWGALERRSLIWELGTPV